jgi:hypothetical protein
MVEAPLKITRSPMSSLSYRPESPLSSPHKSAFSQGDVVRIVTMESFKLAVSDPTLGIQSHTSILSEYKLIV